MIEAKVPMSSPPTRMHSAARGGQFRWWSKVQRVLRGIRGAKRAHRLAWISLLLASVCASWFSYQTLLVPQTGNFAPDWGNAQWIRPAQGLAPVAYFRYTTGLSQVPDSAFLTIAASQTFKLYVNGHFIGSNTSDFLQGIFPRTYIYDVSSALQSGANVFAICVANVDEQAPALKVDVGFLQGNSVYTHGSGDDWLATYQSADVFPRYATKQTSWTETSFDASSWHNATAGIALPFTPMLTANPELYEYPTAQQWMGAGLSHDAYFVRQVSLPLGVTGAWLRLAATGIANIYINGHLFIVWDGQADVPDQTLSDYLADNGSNQDLPEYRAGLVMGLYNIAAYLHPGTNTLAIHVLSPGISAAQVGLDTLSADLSIDMLYHDWRGQSVWLASTRDWHAATRAVTDWEQGNSAALTWPAPLSVGRPGAVRSLYLPDNVTVRNQQMPPVPLTMMVILVSVGVVVSLWLFMACTMRRYYRRYVDALEATSLSYLPSVALAALLLALAREPQIPQPFPYTEFWGGVLLTLVGVSWLFLWFHARKSQQAAKLAVSNGYTRSTRIAPLRTGLLRLYRYATTPIAGKNQQLPPIRGRAYLLLREYWPVLLLMLLAAPMICYNLSYEPYWQDELSSYYVSRSILTRGLSFFPSGFYYPKAELFSYCVALWTLLFGSQQSTLRLLSALEYLLSLPLLYRVGRTFFDRRIALLATVMLAFSPIALVWGRQMRMYEQAQLLTLLTAYLFFRAVQEQKKVYLVYLAASCLVLDYLSHEEIFIVLPALLLCILVVSKERKRYLSSVLYQKHWWMASIACAAIIGMQLLIAKYSHPPLLGTDSSQQPFVQFTTANIPFYVELLFFPSALGNGTEPFIAINSLLALAGCILVRRTANKGAKYCALFLLGSLLTLIFVFTMRADRYIYPILPFYYLMAACAMVGILRAFWNFARAYLLVRVNAGVQKKSSHSQHALSPSMHIAMVCIASLVCASVLIAPILPLSSYNLFVSRLVGFSYHRHYPDYDAAGQYMQQHIRKGDIVIAVSPAVSLLYYVGHVDYYFSLDRALFVFEQHGHIVETTTGAQALLNQDDFQAVLSTYKRVWIVSDNGSYQAAVYQRFSFPPDFHRVFEGYGSAVYFRGSE